MTLDDYIAALERLRRRHGGSIEVACWVERDEQHWVELAPPPSGMTVKPGMTRVEALVGKKVIDVGG